MILAVSFSTKSKSTDGHNFYTFHNINQTRVHLSSPHLCHSSPLTYTWPISPHKHIYTYIIHTYHPLYIVLGCSSSSQYALFFSSNSNPKKTHIIAKSIICHFKKAHPFEFPPYSFDFSPNFNWVFQFLHKA